MRTACGDSSNEQFADSSVDDPDFILPSSSESCEYKDEHDLDFIPAHQLKFQVNVAD